jgi:hypothetical protein
LFLIAQDVESIDGKAAGVRYGAFVDENIVPNAHTDNSQIAIHNERSCGRNILPAHGEGSGSSDIAVEDAAVTPISSVTLVRFSSKEL